MTRRKTASDKPRATSLPPAGARSGRGAASVMPYLDHQLASKPKTDPAGDAQRRKRRRGK